jgi:putative ABC transport system permease protein
MGTVVQPLGDESRQIPIGADSVSVGYFEALGGTMIAGRFFDARDVAGAPPVAIVNQTAARHFWPDDNAVGQSVETPGGKRYEVLGVLGDVRRATLEAEPGPAIYFPNVQARNFSANNLLVRVSGDPKAIVPALRAGMRQLDPEQALVRIQTLRETIALATAPRRFTLTLVGAFSLLALGLAMVGIYGVIAESVARRVPEIGIRLALGATTQDVITMIVRQGAWFLAVGIPIGLAGATALRSTMSSLVFGVDPVDLQAYAAACACLAAATLAASLIPARRAAAIDPVRALRQP